MSVIGDLYWRIKGDTKDIDKSLKKTDTKVGGLQKTFGGLSKFISGAFVAVAVAGIAKVGKATIGLAADAAESVNAVEVVFGDAAEGILAFSENSVKNLGLSSTAFNELSTVIGAQLKLAGGDIDLLDDKVIELSTRAADVASVFNVDVNDSLTAFGSALRGEAEPARRFGVNISDVAVQAEALASGLIKNKNEMTDQIKIQARYNIIMKQTDDLAGDFNNTQGSFSNQLKIAKASVSELGIEIGQTLLPAATKSVTIFTTLISKAVDFAAATNTLAAAQKAVADGTATTEQSLLALNVKLNQLNKSREMSSGLLQVNTKYVDLQIIALENEIAAITNRTIAVQEGETVAGRAAAFAADQATKRAEEATAEAEREATRLEDLRIRDEAYTNTEQGRIDAIEAEIALFETYKESDEKAKVILAELREELAEMTTDSEIAEEAYAGWVNTGSAAWDTFLEKQEAARLAQLALMTVTVDWQALMEGAVTSSLSGFESLGYALAAGEDAFTAFGKTALGSLAEVLRALGAQLAAQAAAAIATALLGGVYSIPAIAGATAGSAAAYTAAGAIDYAATQLADGGIVMPSPGGTIAQIAEAGQAEAVIPLDKLEKMLGGQNKATTLILNIDGKRIAQTTANYYNNGVVELNI